MEALKALMPFYYGKIKCIYIDPPYNTGKEKWVYNDKVNAPKIKEWLDRVVGPEGEDLCRHDKWLCMMYPRLKLLKDLLSNDGVIFVSIDDNELTNLKTVMDDIFGVKNIVANIIVQSNPRGKQQMKIAVTHEYLLVYAKDITKVKLKDAELTEKQIKEYNKVDDNGRRYREIGLRKRGAAARRVDVPNLFYPIYINPKTDAVSLTQSKYFTKKSIPLLSNNEEGRWRWSKKKFGNNKDKLIGRIVNGNKWDVFEMDYLLKEDEQKLTKYKSVWVDKELNYEKAKDLLKQIFNGRSPFDYPKTTFLLKRIIQLITNQEDLILDSFAGSGTTGHAVLDFNKEDGGNRKFILVELEKNIAKKITAERIKRVIRGYFYKKNRGEKIRVKGLGGGFEYVELGEPLFNENGMINEKVSYGDMARYIFFTETHTNLESRNIKENYLGRYGDYHYFLLFDGIKNNILNRKFLKEIKKKDGKKIVYADKCLLDEDILEKHQIIFKQIPYEVKIY
ncbi:MAG: site-specific DNA-methyltransferase [Candidatus Nealsonbacteria bacterium]|nr:site-specific DNA-methyltransferase [Candidatus Nealsonbacteria bacterium]